MMENTTEKPTEQTTEETQEEKDAILVLRVNRHGCSVENPDDLSTPIVIGVLTQALQYFTARSDLQMRTVAANMLYQEQQVQQAQYEAAPAAGRFTH